MIKCNPLPASFRDPSGFVFQKDRKNYRYVNQTYAKNYELLLRSGLYKSLKKKGWLISHKEIENHQTSAYKVLLPYQIPFISYPYEWCFSQLKDAALLTLNILKESLKFGMILKDASAYNIQFLGTRPVLIDTLSFEKYREGLPWNAYKQFCQHFLGPLALMSYQDIRFGQTLKIFTDGIPLNFASKQLPFSSLLNLSLFSHIHLHAKFQKKYRTFVPTNKTISKPISSNGLLGIIDSLYCCIKSLNWKVKNTEWGEYYKNTNYSQIAFDSKKNIVKHFSKTVAPSTVYDLGANDGTFSRILKVLGANNVVSLDLDPVTIEKNYFNGKACDENTILPLVMDITNLSPSLGWNLDERASFINRGQPQLVLSLAIIHHLAISNNLPFSLIAKFLRSLGEAHIIEFIPKEDSQVKDLLSFREDIFANYSKNQFEVTFSKLFEIEDCKKIEDSDRYLYLFRAKKDGA